MTERENLLKIIRFERPDYIPMSFHVTGACWRHYPQEALIELMAAHPFLFPEFEPPALPVQPQIAPWRRAGAPYVDSWGCTWETVEEGLTGAVIDRPLGTWDNWPGFASPSPETDDGWGPIDWAQKARALEQARAEGKMAGGSLRHGHTFLTLIYLRGYENVVLDMADGEPRLEELIAKIEAFNAGIVQRYLELGVEWMSYPEDLGMQVGPMTSPRYFRTYIQPVYQRLMAPAREAGCIVHMHSDGDIRALVSELLAGGVEVINLQDLVNGIDWIKAHLAGKVCVDLDVDRQQITRFGTPAQIDALIRDEVEQLGCKEGGLMMTFGLVPGAPLENVAALMDAMTRYAGAYG